MTALPKAFFAQDQMPLVENLATFRRSQDPGTVFVVPEIPQRRRLTDVAFLITFGVCILIFLPFLIYSLVNADIRRIINGVDSCGNVCGMKNSHIDGIECSGVDMTNKPLLEYVFELYGNPMQGNFEGRLIPYQCVEECNFNAHVTLHRCYPSDHYSYDLSDILSDASEAITGQAGDLVGLCFIGLGFALLMLALFRYFTAFVVWGILIGTILAFVALTIFFWYMTATDDPDYVFLSLAIVFTIISILFLIFFLILMSRIKLIIKLFKETIKVIFTMPLILLQPILTFVVGAIVCALFIVFFLLTWSAGTLTEVETSRYEYKPNFGTGVALWLNIILALWMFQFIYGCQYMVISGAISAGYFARDKLSLVSPIYNSFYNLVRYHLGTVAFGSLTITIFTILKMIIRGLTNNQYGRIFRCCLDYIDRILRYMTSLGYTVTAIHGQPFCRSCMRGLNLILANFLNSIAVNSVGDFVLGMAQLLVIALTIGIGLLMDNGDNNYWVIITLGTIFAFVFARSFFTAFQISLDTIYICFCEDQMMNDGVNSQYYTNLAFMQYMQEAQTVEKQRREKLAKKKK